MTHSNRLKDGLDEIVSMKWRRSIGRSVVHGLGSVERQISKSDELGLGAAKGPQE